MDWNNSNGIRIALDIDMITVSCFKQYTSSIKQRCLVWSRYYVNVGDLAPKIQQFSLLASISMCVNVNNFKMVLTSEEYNFFCANPRNGLDVKYAPRTIKLDFLGFRKFSFQKIHLQSMEAVAVFLLLPENPTRHLSRIKFIWILKRKQFT